MKHNLSLYAGEVQWKVTVRLFFRGRIQPEVYVDQSVGHSLLVLLTSGGRSLHRQLGRFPHQWQTGNSHQIPLRSGQSGCDPLWNCEGEQLGGILQGQQRWLWEPYKSRGGEWRVGEGRKWEGKLNKRSGHNYY